MKIKLRTYLVLALFNVFSVMSFGQTERLGFDFLGEQIDINIDPAMRVPFDALLNEAEVFRFYSSLNASAHQPVIETLLACRNKNQLDDWLFYQLVRRAAQELSPKQDNYYRYTLYKWFLLNKCGYDATLSIGGDKLLFYVQSDEDIFNIPYHLKNNKQYVCLNYHDYGTVDFEKTIFKEVPVMFNEAVKAFTYKVTQLPAFGAENYTERDLKFDFYQETYSFRVKINPQVKTLFVNYPALDYSYYLNTPLSHETYQSLIPAIKKNLKGLTKKEGIDFLMRFTRYAFLFEPDVKVFGQEKRLTPEETLLYGQSDCEDRAALFFYLVKEIYQLPMIVLVYPKHVTIAVNFEKPLGQTITYEGKKYTVCEPTPQRKDLRLGQLLPELRNEQYEIVYAYDPKKE